VILGLELEHGREIQMTNPGKAVFKVFAHTVKARLGKKEFPLEVGFSTLDDFPYILGKDIVNHFTLVMDKDGLTLQGNPP
jgi:hypothetical protein